MTLRMVHLLCAPVCLLGMASCVDGDDDGADVVSRAGGVYLQDSANPSLPIVGAAVRVGPLSDAAYRDTLADHYNQVTVENALKWATLRPAQGVYAFSDADAILDEAESNGQSVRGHTLVWEVNLPAWLQGLGPAAVEAQMHEHIATVVDRYAGRIAHWDVVNEAIDAGGNFRNNLFYQSMGADYVRQAFVAAHAADPGASLAYNDFGIEVSGPKQDGVFDLVADLLAAGAPVHEVGIQMHAHPYDWANGRIDQAELRAAIARFGSLGVDVYVTELDVRIDELSGADADMLQMQRDVYHNVAAACRAEPACRGVTTWGFSDAHTYLPQGLPLPFDANYVEKPAFDGLHDGIAGVAAAPVVPYWDSACPMTGALFCDPIESDTFHGLGKVLVAGGTVASTTNSYRGERAVQVNVPTAGSTRRAYVERTVGGDIDSGWVWTRAYLYVPSSSPNNFTAFAFDEKNSPHYGVSFGVHTDGRVFLRTGGPSPYRKYGPQFPRDEWICFEMQIKVAESGVAKLYMDGALVGSITGRDTHFASDYGTVKAGVIWSPAGGTPVEVSADEVAVGRTRLSCD